MQNWAGFWIWSRLRERTLSLLRRMRGCQSRYFLFLLYFYFVFCKTVFVFSISAVYVFCIWQDCISTDMFRLQAAWRGQLRTGRRRRRQMGMLRCTIKIYKYICWGTQYTNKMLRCTNCVTIKIYKYEYTNTNVVEHNQHFFELHNQNVSIQIR